MVSVSDYISVMRDNVKETIYKKRLLLIGLPDHLSLLKLQQCDPFQEWTIPQESLTQPWVGIIVLPEAAFGALLIRSRLSGFAFRNLKS